MAPRLPNSLARSLTSTSLNPTSTSTSIITSPAPLLSHTPLSHTPSRAATLIRRPRRPYAFTQLVQQSDGSTFTVRTASPIGLYKSAKDSRNHVLWNPSEKALQDVEVDEAGKLAAFRSRFGRGWDTVAPASETVDAAAGAGGKEAAAREGVKGEGDAAKADAKNAAPEPAKDTESGGYDALSDLISGYAKDLPDLPWKPVGKGGKKKGEKE
ncbi:hypothetical protein F4777DRAFT_65830 [Nemania sp. FL0916]|nr:hypothetical protein F4777DRAFT_65830 [Nemania sp. FL0916]